MKIKAIFLKTACLFLLLLSSSAFIHAPNGNPPKEIILLYQHDDGRVWKEYKDIPSDDGSEVFRVPEGQDLDTAEELVVIATKKSKDRNRKVMSPKMCAASMKKTAREVFPKKDSTWEALRIGEIDILYESTLLTRFKNIPPCHQLTRLLLTDDGYIELTFQRAFKQMSKEERAKWIETLESATVIFQVSPAAEVKPTKPGLL